MEATESSAWGASYRLVASEKWKVKSSAMGRDVTEAIVEYAQPRLGMQVLDLAAGTGEPGITLAQKVGLQGRVIGVDQSTELLRIAAERARQKKLTNFVTQSADAHKLPFEDASFDLATCRFGVMFFRDPVGALAELRRVLKPGARACFVAWGTFEQPYWQTTVQIVHRHAGGDLLVPGGPDPFRFSRDGSLSEVLRVAGFSAAEESKQKVPWTWPGSTEEVFDYMCSVSTPFRAMIDRVPEGEWPAIRAEAHAAIERYRQGDEIRFGATVVLASGKA